MAVVMAAVVRVAAREAPVAAEEAVRDGRWRWRW